MREFLFRGKRKDNGEWIIRDNIAKCAYEVDDETKELIEVYSYYLNGVIVDAKTVGQYTGLTDKNGKKIFVGDIVAGAVWWQEQAKNGIVVFKDGSFGLLWYRGEVEQFNAFTSMCNIEYEVIGNIHDNPELLKGGAE